MNVQKFGKNAIAQVLAHCERQKNNTRAYANENIDKSKTHLNKELSGQNGYNTHKEILKNVYHLNRDDVKTMVGICVTLPKDYNGDTFNADYHMFPAILTHYDPRTKEILFTELFLNTTCNKVSANEPETKKNTEFVQYSWNSEDYFQINRKNYVYVDEFTATAGENKEFSLTREVAEDVAAPIYYVLVDYEYVPDTDYTITTSDSATTITFDEEVTITDKTNVMVVYETNLTTIQ